MTIESEFRSVVVSLGRLLPDVARMESELRRLRSDHARLTRLHEEFAADGPSAFDLYAAIVWALSEHCQRPGATAQGFGRIMRDVAIQCGLPRVRTVPLPSLTRAERESQEQHRLDVENGIEPPARGVGENAVRKRREAARCMGDLSVSQPDEEVRRGNDS